MRGLVEGAFERIVQSHLEAGQLRSCGSLFSYGYETGESVVHRKNQMHRMARRLAVQGTYVFRAVAPEDGRVLALSCHHIPH